MKYLSIRSVCVFLILFAVANVSWSQNLNDKFRIARLKYGGGGDWYVGPTAIPNLLRFISNETDVETSFEEDVIELGNPRLFNFPFLFITGHGNIRFTDREVEILRKYLESGGFLHADDCYGMDHSFRREMKRVIPESEFVELPFSHPIYHSHFRFPNGLPKIHEHDGKPPQGLGLFIDERLVVFYTYETDLHDGWQDEEVHNNPPEKRLAALRMGANIVIWFLRGGT